MPPLPTIADLATMALMSPSQRDHVQTEIDALESALGGVSMHGVRLEDASGQNLHLLTKGGGEGQRSGQFLPVTVPVPDAAVLREQLRRNRETLQKGSPPEYSHAQKNRLWEMAKALRAEIPEGMPSHDQLWRPSQDNVDLFMRHQDATIQQQLALRNIMRILDGQDETVVLEAIRPHEPSRLNSRLYWGNFEKIYMTTAAEREQVIHDMAPAIYQRFLLLHARGIDAPKLIMQDLGISLVVYEACREQMEADFALLPVHTGGVEDDEPEPTGVPALESRARVAPRADKRRGHQSKAQLAAAAAKRHARAAAQAQREQAHPDSMAAFAASTP